MQWYDQAKLSNTDEFKTNILLNRTNDGFTLLQQAVTNGNIDLIKLVLQWYDQEELRKTDDKETIIVLNRPIDGFNLLQGGVGVGGVASWQKLFLATSLGQVSSICVVQLLRWLVLLFLEHGKGSTDLTVKLTRSLVLICH